MKNRITKVQPSSVSNGIAKPLAISRFLMFLHLKRYPHKLSKKNKLINRKIDYETYCWGDYQRGIFSERLQVLIDNCTTYQQYYRCQAMLKGYIEKYGEYENDGWIFFGNRISIVVRALEIQVKGIEKAIGRVECRLNGLRWCLPK